MPRRVHARRNFVIRIFRRNRIKSNYTARAVISKGIFGEWISRESFFFRFSFSSFLRRSSRSCRSLFLLHRVAKKRRQCTRTLCRRACAKNRKKGREDRHISSIIEIPRACFERMQRDLRNYGARQTPLSEKNLFKIKFQFCVEEKKKTSLPPRYQKVQK